MKILKAAPILRRGTPDVAQVFFSVEIQAMTPAGQFATQLVFGSDPGKMPDRLTLRNVSMDS